MINGIGNVYGSYGSYNSSLYGSSSIFNQSYKPTSLNFNNSTAKSASSSLLQAYSTSLNNTASFLSSMKSVNSAATPLRQSGYNSVWSAGEAKSSNTNVLTASMTGPKSSSTYTVKVEQTAAAQISKSSQLTANEKTSMSAGVQAFSIQTDSKTFNFYADIKSTDTNQAALTKMATAINDSKSGVKASVVTENNKSQLVLTGQTGESKSFSFNGAGDVASLNVQKTQDVRNAKYSVNDQSAVSESNTVKLESGKFSLELKGVGSATVSSESSPNKAASAITDFVNSYNAAVKNISNMPQTRQIANVQNFMKITNFDQGQLRSMGVTVNSDKTLTVDQNKLKSAIQTNSSSVQQTFSRIARQSEGAFRSAQSINQASLNAAYTNSLFNSSGYQYGGGLLLNYFL